jgi:hypothetical protein
MAVEVAELAGGGTDDREREQRARDDPRDRARVAPELAGDPRDRDGQDRDREADREQPEQGGGEDDPRVPGTVRHAAVHALAEQQRPGEDRALVGARCLDRHLVDRGFGGRLHRSEAT